MSSEWMKVMLEEIARKKAEAELAHEEERVRNEEQRRVGEPDAPPRSATYRA
jgi:hypothetical protein